MEHIMIKTRFHSKEALVLDKTIREGRSSIFFTGKGKLWIDFKENNRVVLTCDGRAFGKFEFIGDLMLQGDALCFVGQIAEREDILKRQKYIIVSLFILAIILFMSGNAVFIFMAFLMILVNLINLFGFKNTEPFCNYLEKCLG